MNILNHTRRKLEIEWRPWGHSFGWLAFTLLMTFGLIDTWPDRATAAPKTLAASVVLVLFCYVQLYIFGQMTRLTLDREAGRVVIFRRTLLGSSHTVIPLHEIVGPWILYIPGQWRMTNLRLRRQGTGGLSDIMVPRAPFFTDGAHHAARAISDWLDSDRPAT